MFTIFAMLIGTLVLDSLVRPRATGRGNRRPLLRSPAGIWLLLLIATAVFGLGLALSGNHIASAAGVLVAVGVFTIVSNAKRAMLGEALLFTDLALLSAVFRHPQFYLSALTRLQKTAVMAAVPAVLLVGWLLFRPHLASHMAGLAILGGCLTLLWLSMALPPWRDMVQHPQHDDDVRRHGLLPMILVYWLRWRASQDPASPTALGLPGSQPGGDLAILVQCESFADPADLFEGAGHDLPMLASARSMAWQWGNLQVSGFGAYTMRTEYGVLFGREEEELGFRRFDPYLTALGEAMHAMPAKLAANGWQSRFLHPYDLRFYNRREIMRAAGFDQLLGQDGFPPVEVGRGPYLPDAVVADVIMDHAARAPGHTMIYAVTIENHGPWKPAIPGASLTEGYMAMVRNGDAMLGSLLDRLAALRRATTLVFFGDHRPSITGVTSPDGARHTPYVIVRLDEAGQPMTGSNGPVDLTPAQLHHAVCALLVTQARDQAADSPGAARCPDDG